MPSNNKTPLELLANDPHVISVFPGEDWPLPEFDIGSFHGDSHRAVKRAMNTLRGFVRTPYIVDSFRDHDDRRKWLASLTKQLGDWVEVWYDRQNCLRFGKVSKITSPDSMLDLHVLRPYTGPKKDGLVYAAERVTRMDLGHQRVYDQKSPMEKVGYVMKVKRRVHDLLYWV